jgi:protein-arginine kinase activator protein McsA
MRPDQPSPIPSPIKLCVHCGFTVGEFQARRLLGCPHCYSSLGDALLADFLVLHPALGTSSWGTSAWPSDAQGAELTSTDVSTLPQLLAAWRERLNDAVRREDYAEAAALKARIDAATRSGTTNP